MSNNAPDSWQGALQQALNDKGSGSLPANTTNWPAALADIYKSAHS